MSYASAVELQSIFSFAKC